MSELYPLKFQPIFKDKIWGGNKIATILKQNYAPLYNCGEVWLVSGIADEPSVVTNGFLAENSLQDLLEIYMGDLVGDGVYEKFGDEFPLLFKFINAEDYLSVQVHPNDELAMERHDCLGKTEMWYIIHADEGAELISGFKPNTEKPDYLKHLKANSLKDILNYETVKHDDVFYVPAGLVHAVGPGILLAEIQQSSDITYRMYDWDRFDMSGMQRELHTDLALDAIQFEEPSHKSHPASVKNREVLLHESEYFNVRLIDADKRLEMDYIAVDSFVVYLCTEGSFDLVYPHGTEQVSIGEAILIPAEIKEVAIVPTPTCKILETYIK